MPGASSNEQNSNKRKNEYLSDESFETVFDDKNDSTSLCSSDYYDDLDISSIKHPLISPKCDVSYSSSSEETFFASTSTTDAFACIPDKTIELIFQHFSTQDVKTASCVSIFWYHKIGKSMICMKKLKLKLDLENSMLILMKSSRNYANIQIDASCNPTNCNLFNSIVRKFASSLTNLEVTKVGGFNTILNEILLLTRLECLKLNIICGRITGEFLSGVCTLKILSVNGLDPSGLKMCLEQNPEFEDLTLYENSFISYFSQDFTNAIPFNLKKLSVLDHFNTKYCLAGEFPAERWNSVSRYYFYKFLTFQATTLHSLHLDNCHVDDLNKILKLLTLKTLEINWMVGDLQKVSLEKNFTVINFIASSRISTFLLESIVENLKNMKTMFINRISTHQFLYILRKSYQLKSFHYFWAYKIRKPRGNFINLSTIFRHELFRACKFNELINFEVSINITTKEEFLKLIE
ncbi:CLUMA_CG010014, isoform A [Clunio marinus]|uniref:CLUMA_CG010014, isoform A n=1 Tax=Clunio marinus TaxID=568069 RepID=A0A1J1I9H6_9DIPT|nr:CLUMA_CG010014, isoform A [Clunio marinus]